jgi:predicted DNA-binding protein with PD1-like motif
MQSINDKGLIIVRLFTNEETIPALKEVCKQMNVKTAVVVSAIGQIKNFTLGYFDGSKYLNRDCSEVYELISLSGIISQSQSGDSYDVHLHASVGNSIHQVFGGHLTRAVVQATNEIVLLKSDLKVQRKFDQSTGLTGLFLE